MKKLSQMNADELSNVLCKIVVPMERMMGDPEVVSCFQGLMEMIRGGKTSPMEFFGRCITLIVPVFLGEMHRDDTFAVAAALKGQTVDEVRKQPGVAVITEVIAMLTGDAELLAIFRPAAGRKGKKAAGRAVQARAAADGEGVCQPD